MSFWIFCKSTDINDYYFGFLHRMEDRIVEINFGFPFPLISFDSNIDNQEGTK